MLLRVDALSSHYGDLRAIWHVDMHVPSGEIVVLLGSNGAGKSSVIRAISGQLRPSGGKIVFDGVRLDQQPAQRIIDYGVVHVPEGRRLFAEMSVEENLIMGSLSSRAKPHRKENLERIYTLFPKLLERRKQHAGTLSGGEQQMVALGRGLMAMPRLLMLDEPTLGLSPLMAKEIFRMVRRIHQDGVTVLLVEQNVHRSLAICDRGFVLENGRTILSGSGAELSAHGHVRQTYLGLDEGNLAA